jgi:AraC-like DNA-binding protein
MKAILEDIPSKKGAASFYSTRISVPAFEFKWHYHPEYELTYIVRGSGYRIVGNSHEHFSAGDLVLLGSNLPHTWWGKQEDGSPSEAIVIQFSNAFIEPFLQLQESQSIKELLTKASRGLRWDNDQMLFHSIEELGDQTEFNRILSLLSILQTLSQIESSQLASDSYQNVLSKKFESRINKVCSYLQLHFSESISLKQVADLVYMSESNFCKFFKKATSTTFSDYLNDLRINEACHLLLSTEDNISKIAHDSGFESLSYFNRVFLRKKHLTPSEFRKI